MTNAIITELKSLVARFEGEAKADASAVEGAASAGLAYLKSKVPNAQQAIAIGEGLLASLAAGTSWPDTVAALIAEAAKEGIELAAETATIALNYAQSNLIAQGRVTVPAA